jgi:segregation and condensation protein A
MTLAHRGIAGRDVFVRGAMLDEARAEGLPPLAELPLFSLVEAFQRVLARAKVKVAHDVVPDRISIVGRIHELYDLLSQRRRADFDQLFENAMTRIELVVTFLALLEMTRLRMMRLYQVDPQGQLHVELNENADPTQVVET